MVSSFTLREALNKFHHDNSKLVSAPEMAAESKDFFNCHDVAHVVFGCDTTVQGEGVVKLWTIFGTTLGFIGHIKEYDQVNALGLAQQYKMKQLFIGALKIISLVPIVIIRARKMNKKWPWSSFDDYLDVSIGEIRDEFNIRPVVPL